MTAIDDFRDQIRNAARDSTRLRIRGAGTKDFCTRGAGGEVLDTRAHAGIVAYEPTELYVTARCGTTLADLERALDEHGQMLAFEPPHYAGGATLGGAVAAGLSGPRRMHAGPLRDFVLGTQIIDGTGELLRFGGRVMKNVAGYDVSRLMAGSLGSLALMTEVTVKVMPRPAAELTLRFELPQANAITVMNEWAGRPLPISATAWRDGVLTVRLSGGAAAISEAREKLGGKALDDLEAREFWQAVRDHTLPWFAVPLWRLSVPTPTPPLDLPGEQLIEWTGGLRWLRSDAEPGRIRGAAEAAGGSATLFRAIDPRADESGALPPAVAALQKRVKQVFDPHGVFGGTL